MVSSVNNNSSVSQQLQRQRSNVEQQKQQAEQTKERQSQVQEQQVEAKRVEDERLGNNVDVRV
jgi:hypothetical protein